MIRVVRADITTLDVEALVNAADPSLLGGGGVDGAIHLAAGPGLLHACRSLGGLPHGDAKVTGGYDLAARLVVHAVGPIWRGGEAGEADLLAACYRRALELADGEGCRSVAFPAISTGAYGYPHDAAARIAVRTGAAVLPDLASVEEVLLVSLDARTERYPRNAAKGAGVDVH